MGKINVLDASVFNMLAAGEVVERPSSVVKELIENSIDAGATVIDISLQEGGTRLIEVSDNGVGIAREDIRAAFLPHATSKLKEIIDLDSLSTLGFRGEALASIASVSEVTAVSAQKGEAYTISLSAGKVVSEGIASRREGTAITVENLFFNTPARLKFLKRPQLEQKYCEDVVRHLILANPQLSISLYADGEEVLSHSGGTLFDAIVSVYGAKNADGLIEISNFESKGVRVCGYISSPDCTRSTRAFQNIVVNGRTVQDQTVTTAAERAYGNLLMKRTFPIFVLDIVLPFDLVDVNVHPSKTEVRFADKQAIFSAVYHAVRNALDQKPSVSSANDSHNDNYELQEEQAAPDNPTPRVIQPRIDSSRFYATPPKRPASFMESAIPAYKGFGEVPAGDNGSSLRSDDVPFSASESDESGHIDGEEFDSPSFEGKIIGQIFATYLVVEQDEVVYIIDQHAAHERVLYDKIYARMTPEYTQSLLIPYKLMLTGEETEQFERLIQPLEAMGFELEFNGGNYVINAVPDAISRVNFSKFFSELLNTAHAEDVSLADLMRESLCQQACKAAIKGGEALTRRQIARVLSTLSDEQGNLPRSCPHGRPAYITISKTDIEKLFKRIV